MKRFIKPLILFTVALVFCMIMLGFMMDLQLFKTLTETMCAVLSAFFLINSLELFIKSLNRKRKRKTNEIKVKVIFLVHREDYITHVSKIFSDTDLKECVFDIIKYARLSKYKIRSMELLTTE